MCTVIKQWRRRNEKKKNGKKNYDESDAEPKNDRNYEHKIWKYDIHLV